MKIKCVHRKCGKYILKNQRREKCLIHFFRRNKIAIKKARLPSKYELTNVRYPDSDDCYDEVTFHMSHIQFVFTRVMDMGYFHYHNIDQGVHLSHHHQLENMSCQREPILCTTTGEPPPCTHTTRPFCHP